MTSRTRNDWAPRRVLVAPDKFKGTLSSSEVSSAIVSGLRRVWPRAQYDRFEIADGGDGFCACLTKLAGGKMFSERTVDARGKPRRARVGLIDGGRTRVIDLASASGIALVAPSDRDPASTSTVGTGRLIRKAIERGCSRLIIGLGGSASNDGGIGIASELGYQFLDKNGVPVSLNGSGLLSLEYILAPEEQRRVQVTAATDVDNPLFGRNGAAYQFAPQKGADERGVRLLDRGLRNLDRVVQRDLGLKRAHVPGAGAAGGCGYGLMVFLGAVIQPGLDLIADYGELHRKVQAADLVVTGEGRFDRTSFAGKAPFRVATAARKLGIPVAAVIGSLGLPGKPRIFDHVEVLPRLSARKFAATSAKAHRARVTAAATVLASALTRRQPA